MMSLQITAQDLSSHFQLCCVRPREVFLIFIERSNNFAI